MLSGALCSDVVGAKVMAQASKTLKKVQLELGGKSVLIVRRDADLELAVMLGLRGFTTAQPEAPSLHSFPTRMGKKQNTS